MTSRPVGQEGHCSLVVVVMFCRNFTLTLFKWQKENYQHVFSDNATGTLRNRLNPILP